MLRVNTGGNFCGHNPSSPQKDILKPIKTGKGGLPRVLSLAKERLAEYFSRPALFPTLNGANQSSRQQRSERRESCILVLEGLLKFCDVVSLRVGIPTKDGWKNITVDFLVSHIGLTKRRVERALKDLKTSGILRVKQPRTTNGEGQIRGLPALRVLSSHFFAALGLGTILKMEQKKAKKRRKASQNEQEKSKQTRTEAEKGRQGLLFSALGNLFNGKGKPSKGDSVRSERGVNKSVDLRRRELDLQLQIIQAYPNWSEEQIRAEVAKRL